ncbi:MAG: hypothetical protein KBT66_04225, partial [Amphritea sp.]|nr:hypothetical protein [Amphritea sp.]
GVSYRAINKTEEPYCFKLSIIKGFNYHSILKGWVYAPPRSVVKLGGVRIKNDPGKWSVHPKLKKTRNLDRC